MSRLVGDLFVSGFLSSGTMRVPDATVTDAAVAPTAAIARSKLALDSFQPYSIDLLTLRIWNAITTFLSTAGSDDLGIPSAVTFGTATPTVITSDAKAASITQYARFLFVIPIEWDTGSTLQIAINAGMDTTISDTSATIDVEAYASDGFGGVTSDHVTTAAQSINSLTPATKTFNLNTSGLAPGSTLDVRVAIAIVDGATATAVTGVIGKIDMLCDVKG